VRVGVGESFTIDASGGAVVHIDSLTLQGPTRIRSSYGYNSRSCYFDNYGQYSSLIIQNQESEQVVLNIDRLWIGNCAQLDLGPDVIFNVPGRGPRIRIGFGVYGGGVNLLAPERNLQVFGTGDDSGTFFSRAWVRGATIGGLTYLEDDYTLCDDQ
jgi:hypothetical protein